MKAGYTIENRGTDKPNVIYVYNWHTLNEVDNVRFHYGGSPAIKDKIIAIFKIKYK